MVDVIGESTACGLSEVVEWDDVLVARVADFSWSTWGGKLTCRNSSGFSGQSLRYKDMRFGC